MPLGCASAFLDPDLAAKYLTRLFVRQQSRLWLRLCFSSTPGKKRWRPYRYPYPDLYSHKPWYNIWGHSSCLRASSNFRSRSAKITGSMPFKLSSGVM